MGRNFENKDLSPKTIKKAISPRDRFTKKELSLGFKKAWDLIEEYFKKKDYLGCYFLVFSVLEDRLNSCYKVSLWRSRSKKFDLGVMPSYEDVYMAKVGEKIKILKEDFLITESLEKKLLKVVFDRNTKFHSTMWMLDEFTKSSIIDVVSVAREFDKVRRKQKKTMGK
jgi:hypothetical protein